jgi:DNA-binding transcriptional MerR regulator
LKKFIGNVTVEKILIFYFCFHALVLNVNIVDNLLFPKDLCRIDLLYPEQIMVAYSIKDLENLSGVKAHTLRIWEKRYGIITPERTSTNIRYYKEEDLQKILNISLLNRKGFKISKIAELSNEELKAKVAELTEVGTAFEDQLDSLMLAMFDLEESKFNLILNHQIDSKGFEATMDDVVYPLLDKLSNMWLAGSIKSVHENFVVGIIRRKIIMAIENQKERENRDGKRFLLYLPEFETHELSLLFLHYVLLKQGIRVLNLGTNVSIYDVIDAYHIYRAEYIFTIFNDSFSEAPLQPYLDELIRNCPESQILISGFQTTVQKLERNPRLRVLNSIDQVKQFVRHLNSAPHLFKSEH